MLFHAINNWFENRNMLLLMIRSFKSFLQNPSWLFQQCSMFQQCFLGKHLRKFMHVQKIFDDWLTPLECCTLETDSKWKGDKNLGSYIDQKADSNKSNSNNVKNHWKQNTANLHYLLTRGIFLCIMIAYCSESGTLWHCLCEWKREPPSRRPSKYHLNNNNAKLRGVSTCSHHILSLGYSFGNLHSKCFLLEGGRRDMAHLAQRVLCI